MLGGETSLPAPNLVRELRSSGSGACHDGCVPARDIVVIGGSAGSFEIARGLVRTFDAGFPAAVFIVIHTIARSRNLMAEILGMRCQLPVSEAVEGERLAPGKVYLPPPDRHLVIAEGHLHTPRGPKEGMHRPSINVTFRSAAGAYGSRVIGIVLSGMLDDGAAGLWEIAKQGGVTIVQEPGEAQFPSMPNNALKDVPINYRVPVDSMGPLLCRLVSGEEVMPPINICPDEGDERLSGYTCPECRGPLSIRENGPTEFRCRIGHVFSFKELVDAHTATQERKLYEAMVALEEGADLADYAVQNGKVTDVAAFRRESAQLREQAAAIRRIIEERKTPLLD